MKRTIDLLVSLVLLMILSPVILIVSCGIWIFLGRPVFFVQKRAGKFGKPFRIFKFRTMIDIRDKQGMLKSDAERLTGYGKFLRSTSLDELPGLFNVFIGQMSLVGPRPLYVEYISLYSDEQRRRLNVVPGITGWAQVNGRNRLSWSDRFAMDVWYVDNQSLWLDFKILLLTVKKVLARDGISAEGQATMQPFSGED